MIKVGDKMTLKKPMGDFKWIGTECGVVTVNENNITFSCRYGCGNVTLDELKTYFSYDGDVEDAPEFKVGDRIEMVGSDPLLSPMEQGEQFVIKHMEYGAVRITYDMGDERNATFVISHSLLMSNFKLLHNESTSIPFITDEEIDDLIDRSEIDTYLPFDGYVLISCKLPCGYVVTTNVICDDKETFDVDEAVSFGLPAIKQKIRSFEHYRRTMNSYRSKKGA